MKFLLILFIACSGCVFAQEELANANVSVITFEHEPIPGAQIHFRDAQSDKVFSGVSDRDGKFNIELPSGSYYIQLKSVGRVKDYSIIEIPKLEGNEMYGTVDIIIRYEEESTFTLENLHFETGKSLIKSSSYDELDELVRYLELKPEIKIEIGGHTDNVGSTKSNQTLSESRAIAVKEYLISKGINAERILAKGYGESRPIADNNTPDGRAQNRRTEIQILE